MQTLQNMQNTIIMNHRSIYLTPMNSKYFCFMTQGKLIGVNPLKIEFGLISKKCLRNK